ncbi:MAG TPA: aspartyl protease family protein [Pyrinomonadaceae bacterium]|jgi:clan AA aspartic protease
MSLKPLDHEPPFASHTVATNPAVANLTVEQAEKRSNEMGLVYADIELISGRDLVMFGEGLITEDKVKRMTVNVLVDSGALMLTINEEIQTQLGLQQVDSRSAQLADGTLIKLPVVGPVEVRFANRRSSVDAMVLPGDAEPLLGAIPMEDMDVLVDTQQRRLVVNPEHPYIVQHSLK